MKKVFFFAIVLFTAGTVKSQYYVTQFAGSTGGLVNSDTLNAKFNNPVGICVDKKGNFYITEAGNHTIRKIDGNGQVTTYAGAGIAGFQDGAAATARFNQPWGIAIDDTGNLYVSDFLNQRIRKIDTAGKVSTVAGTGVAGLKNGRGDTAQLNYPRGMCFDKNGNLYIADSWNHAIRQLSKTGVLTVFAGNAASIGVGTVGSLKDTIAALAEFYTPTAIVYDGTDQFYVTDAYNHAIRKIDNTGKVSTLAGGKGSGPSGGDFANGNCNIALLNTPTELFYDAAKQMILFSEVGNQRIGSIDMATCKVSSFAGSGTAGMVNGRADTTKMDYPRGIVKKGSDYYFCDFNNHKIRRVYFKTTLSGLIENEDLRRIEWLNENNLRIEMRDGEQVEFFDNVGRSLQFKHVGNIWEISEVPKGILNLRIHQLNGIVVTRIMNPF